MSDFATLAGRYIAREALRREYTKQQVEGATLNQLFNVLNITDPVRQQKIMDYAQEIRTVCLAYMEKHPNYYAPPPESEDVNLKEIYEKLKMIFPNISVNKINEGEYMVNLGI